MAIGVNKVILIGNLGKDPELKYTQGGTPVASFSLATAERWSDKSGERREKTEWHTVVCWGKLGELVNQYLKKGRSAYVEGKLSTRSWEDKDGTKRYKTEVIASQVQFLNTSTGNGGDNPDNRPGEDEPAQQGTVVNDDDLPF